MRVIARIILTVNQKQVDPKDDMSLYAFSLQDSLISYIADRRAARVPKLNDRRGTIEDNCAFRIVSFHDDHSIHANYWERHPAGDEILCVLEGCLLATVDRDGATEDAVIEPGQAFIVPRQSWHRLRVLEPGRLLFFTPRAGSQRRPHDIGAAGQTNSADT
jgi:mannose-6-phosphate isomerase-like protein (cupin superfamily)